MDCIKYDIYIFLNLVHNATYVKVVIYGHLLAFYRLTTTCCLNCLLLKLLHSFALLHLHAIGYSSTQRERERARATKVSAHTQSAKKLNLPITQSTMDLGTCRHIIIRSHDTHGIFTCCRRSHICLSLAFLITYFAVQT